MVPSKSVAIKSEIIMTANTIQVGFFMHITYTRKRQPAFLWCSLNVGWIPKNFKTFIFKPKLSFSCKNHKNDKESEFPYLNEFNPKWLSQFSWNDHSDNEYFRDQFEKSYKGGDRENSWIQSSYYHCDFPSKMKILAWKIKILKILGSSL